MLVAELAGMAGLALVIADMAAQNAIVYQAVGRTK